MNVCIFMGVNAGMFSVSDFVFGCVLLVHYLLRCLFSKLQGKLNNASQVALSYQQKIRDGGLPRTDVLLVREVKNKTYIKRITSVRCQSLEL